MTTPTYGQLIEKVRDCYNFSREQAEIYLASAFYVLANDETVNRIANSLEKN
jgi:hypothetical protein